MLAYKMPTMESQSGSPIIKTENGLDKFIIGVHIGSNSNFTKNIGVVLTPQKRKKINEWVGEVTGKLDLGKEKFI